MSSDPKFIRIGAIVKTGRAWCTHFGVSHIGYYRLMNQGMAPAAALHAHLRFSGIRVNEFYMEDVEYSNDLIVKEATQTKLIWTTHYYDVCYFYRATSSAGYYITKRGMSGEELNKLKSKGYHFKILKEYTR